MHKSLKNLYGYKRPSSTTFKQKGRNIQMQYSLEYPFILLLCPSDAHSKTFQIFYIRHNGTTFQTLFRHEFSILLQHHSIPPILASPISLQTPQIQNSISKKIIHTFYIMSTQSPIFWLIKLAIVRALPNNAVQTKKET